MNERSTLTPAPDPGGAGSEQYETPRERPHERPRLRAWLPGLVVASVAVISLTRTGVGLGAITAFAAYWVVALLIPGTLVHRWLASSRPTLGEDLAFGALTGLALETIAFLTLSAVRLDALIPWWWLTVYALTAAVPALRQSLRHRYEQASSSRSTWAMAAIASVIIARTDVLGFRTIVLAPGDGSNHLDLWWHLSLIQELMGSAPHTVPQISSEPLAYHYFSHLHMAVASRTSGVEAELILFRLWVIPVALATIGVIAGLARQVAGRAGWVGPVTAWLVFGTLVRSYLWPTQIVANGQPLTMLSPSQLFGNLFVAGAAAGFVSVMRGKLSARGAIWLGLVLVAGSGTKSTVMPVLLAGTAVAFLFELVRHRRVSRGLGTGLAVLAAIQIGGFAAGTLTSSGGQITLLGTLRSATFYRALTDDSSLRGLNDGFLLDSIDSGRAVLAATVALGFYLGTSAIRLAGLAALGHRATRDDPVVWWLGGALGAGWAAAFLADHVGVGQIYFLHTVTPFGVVLTVTLAARVLDRAEAVSTIKKVLLLGVGLGVLLALVVEHVDTARARTTAYGVLETALLPVTVAAIFAAACVIVWRRVSPATPFAGLGAAVVLAAVVGVAIPADADWYAQFGSRWFGDVTYPVADPDDPWFVTAEEQEAMLWLRSNSDVDDVIVTNHHCTPNTVNNVYCDSRGFWVTGLGGRAAVIEAWGYTPEALALHGVEDRPWAYQPSPWPGELTVSEAVFAAPSERVLDTLREEYQARWIVGVRRSGEVPDELVDLATPVFENNDVQILRID